MNYPVRMVAVVFLILMCALPPAQAQQLQAVVNGQLIARANNQPASGLLISLVHPFLGRSAPTTSDVYGRFTFFGIPLRHEPYYMEVYWGNQLVYRQTIYVTTPLVNLPHHYI